MYTQPLSAKGRLVRCLTPDRLELEGFLAEPQQEAQPVVFLFLPGMFENFYLPLFVDWLANQITANGFYFLTANTRAQDYLVYFRKWEDENSFTWIREGGSFEIFSNCIPDITGWVNLCESLSKRVVLMGHSHGALRASYYTALKAEDSRIIGLVLLSPSDDVGIQKRKLGSKYNEALQLAENMVRDGHETEFMPTWAYEQPVSAAMYMDMFSPNSDLAIFHFDEPHGSSSTLSKIHVPVLTVFGSDDAATSSISSEKALELTQSSLSAAPAFTGQVIKNTNHHYLRQEDTLAGVIVDWAKHNLFK